MFAFKIRGPRRNIYFRGVCSEQAHPFTVNYSVGQGQRNIKLLPRCLDCEQHLTVNTDSMHEWKVFGAPSENVSLFLERNEPISTTEYFTCTKYQVYLYNCSCMIVILPIFVSTHLLSTHTNRAVNFTFGVKPNSSLISIISL